MHKEGLCAFIRLQTHMTLTWTGLGRARTHSIFHRKYWFTTLLEQNDLQHLLGPFDYTTKHMPQPELSVCIDDGAFAPTFDGLSAFTEGSVMGVRSSSGLAIYSNQDLIHQEFQRLSDQSSVFQAELFAILSAAQFFNSLNLQHLFILFILILKLLYALLWQTLLTRILA